MFKLIEGLPANVLAIEASGQITRQDYRDILIPRAESLMVKGQTKMLYIIGPDFNGFDLQSLWDDSAFGFSHWSGFSRIALVTDHPWMEGVVTMFTPFFPGEVRLFRLAHLPAAKDWIAAPSAAAPS